MRQFSVFVFIISMLSFPTVAQTQAAECGDIIQSEFDEAQDSVRYEIEIEAGTSLDIRGQALGDDLEFELVLTNRDDRLVRKTNDDSGTPELSSGVLGSNGKYGIYASNADILYIGSGGEFLYGEGVGVFTLFISCTLPNGDVVNAGEATPTPVVTVTPETPSTPEFTGFGFPGVSPVDFSAGIEIPLTVGAMQTVPLASDVALYTYAATAGETRTLTLSRASGDLSIGVAVINRDTNEIVFLGGLPSSNNLSVELTFPSDGTYAVGLFRFDTAERTGTSGAVGVLLE